MTFYHGVDLIDLGTDRLTWGRLQSLISQLPRESRTMRAVVGDSARWGEQEHLLATLIDVTAHLTYLFRAANFKGRPEMPDPLPRPGAAAPSRGRRIGGTKTYTSLEVDEILAGMTPKRGE